MSVVYKIQVLYPTWMNNNTGVREICWPRSVNEKYGHVLKEYYLKLLQDVNETIDIHINTDQITIARIDNDDKELDFSLTCTYDHLQLRISAFRGEHYVPMIDPVHIVWPLNRVYKLMDECVTCIEFFIVQEWDQPRQCSSCISKCIICQRWLEDGNIVVFQPYKIAYQSLSKTFNDNQLCPSICNACIEYTKQTCIAQEIDQFIGITALATIIKEYLNG